ncbi:Imm1 family immunity protein [Polymorphospora sp. NPDC051019]|uniref:Imm1 family immunity protein n=1 Tax=Polymorphospora sp. NPDC051019 TaxID=3155725 RepID=UPI00343B3DA6
MIGQIQAGIGGLAVHTSEAATALASVPEQPTPQEVIATLAPVAEKVSGLHDGVGGCIGLVDQARQMTATVLRGGDPGVLLARLDAIQQVLAAVGRHGTATRRQVEAAIAEARKTGGSGNCVSLIVPDGSDFPPMLQICVGHPERSFAYHVAADGSSGWAHQPELDNGPAFTFDYAGTPTDAWPERSRVTPASAQAAAHEFLASGGGRPSNLAWDIVAD